MKKEINAFRRSLMRSLASKVGTSVIDENILSEGLNIKKILVIRPNSRLGNQLLLTPLLQELELRFPGCKIDLFVRGNLAPILLKNYKSIDKVIKLPPKPFKELAKYLNTWLSLRKSEYDLVVNVDGASSSGRWSTKIVHSKYKLYGDEIPKLKERYADYVHMAKSSVYNFRYYLKYDIQEPSILPLSLKLDEEERANGKEVLKSIVKNDKPTICLYTFATGDKCYSKEWWKELYEQVKSEYSETYNLLEVLPKENVSQIDFDATTYYSTDIREMGAVMTNTCIFITGDCGIMHLAASVDVPTVGLFSVTNVAIYEPYNPGSIAIDTTKTSVDEIVRQIRLILKKD